MIKRYYNELTEEFDKQQTNPDADKWAIFSAALNRELREYTSDMNPKHPLHHPAFHAFRLWQDYNAKLRGDKLSDEWEMRVAESRLVLNVLK
ncbi:hypothetical protein MKX40_10575 [Paenibacillus sp. FSL R5-0517]|uniref:hypothetical protein n=1 Tax=Paenibacillus sp. FSL R5-0517 TaxID=2921647 RepID=UPI0030D9E8F5